MKLAWTLLACSMAVAQVNVPRPAPNFQIAGHSGRSTNLSGYRGDVVHLAFVVTTCSHCQAASKEFEKLQSEFGDRGFQVVEAAFDDNGDVAAYSKRLGLTFPVGRTTRAEVCSFLGISQNTRLATPQVVLIDRTGMIRAQSAPEGTPMLTSGDVLRGLIDSMLRRHSVQ